MVASPPSFLDPSVLARIASLELLARVVVEGFLHGLHRAPHFGASTDFAEHRPYMPGDDIRRIDWRLFARTDRYHLKEYEAETNTGVMLLLDVSPSMAFARAGIRKLDYARYLAASLAYLCHRQRDRVGLATFADGIVELVPPSAKHLRAVLHALEHATPPPAGHAGRGAALEATAAALSPVVQRRSVLALISDLYEEPEAVARALGRLRNRGNDLIVFHVLDPAEIEFDFDAPATFEDLEAGERLPVIPEYLRDAYRAQVAAHVAELRRRCGDVRAEYALLDTATPLDHALYRFLSRRERMARVR